MFRYILEPTPCNDENIEQLDNSEFVIIIKLTL